MRDYHILLLLMTDNDNIGVLVDNNDIPQANDIFLMVVGSCSHKQAVQDEIGLQTGRLGLSVSREESPDPMTLLFPSFHQFLLV